MKSCQNINIKPHNEVTQNGESGRYALNAYIIYTSVVRGHGDYAFIQKGDESHRR